MNTDLFYGNTFILFFVFVISVFLIDKMNERQKIAIIYLCVYGMSFAETLPEKILLPLLFFVLFLMQEFFTTDRKKLTILKRIHYKLVDFLYMGLFQYKIWLVSISIIIRTSFVKERLNCAGLILDVTSIWLFGLAFIWMFNLTEEFYSFTEMYNLVWKTPYYNVKFDDDLWERLNIITAFEDRLYWKREKSYSVASLEFIKVWYFDKYGFHNRKRKTKKLKWKQRVLDIIFFYKRVFKVIYRFILVIKKMFCYIWKFFTRGHSTIPMQIIRILSYKHGLVFDSTKIKFRKYKIFKRKIYEILYSHMFFEGLKKYLSVELCNNMEHYKEYLVYLYPQIVQTTIGKITFAPARKAFALKEEQNYIPPLNDWDIEGVIRMCFGFNGMAITEKRMAEKKAIVEKYEFME